MNIIVTEMPVTLANVGLVKSDASGNVASCSEAHTADSTG
jgi:hypothetical protein